MYLFYIILQFFCHIDAEQGISLLPLINENILIV